jgi:hypothetical protein
LLATDAEKKPRYTSALICYIITVLIDFAFRSSSKFSLSLLVKTDLSCVKCMPSSFFLFGLSLTCYDKSTKCKILAFGGRITGCFECRNWLKLNEDSVKRLAFSYITFNLQVLQQKEHDCLKTELVSQTSEFAQLMSNSVSLPTNRI